MVITVTGSTGTIGAELIRLLSDAAAPTRAVFRDARKIQPMQNVAWIQADLRDNDVLEPVLAGTARLFLLSDNEPGFGKLQIQILRVAEQLGVAHVIKLSALGASDHSNSTIAREHWEVEQAIQQMSMSWTILRPHAFMQSWLGEVAASVRAEGVIYSPIESVRVPFIDTRDIAEVAARVLMDPDAHANRKYVLTGGEAVSYADVAAALTAAAGKLVRYRPISMEEARRNMEHRELPQPLIDAMLAIAAYQRAGGPTSRVSDHVEQDRWTSAPHHSRLRA
jgi:uncharacterized protein YbjT (DUF2867 family)